MPTFVCKERCLFNNRVWEVGQIYRGDKCGNTHFKLLGKPAEEPALDEEDQYYQDLDPEYIKKLLEGYGFPYNQRWGKKRLIAALKEAEKAAEEDGENDGNEDKPDGDES